MLSRRPQLSNLPNLRVRQLCPRMIRAALIVTSTPAFLSHVSKIVGLSAKKQVFRIAARRVVALVANKHAFRNWSDVKLVGKAMGSSCYSLPASRESDFPVAVNVATACPNPTRFRFFNAAHESFKQWFGLWRHGISIAQRR